ncbi:MAG TPA: hypothetical protein VFJ02_22315 [Vicinamibacterales bacterium]|nr:hypothetical protein [Vicinamibacterales bacterium]
MTHLTDVEIVDFLEDTLPPPRAAHLENCESCRRRTSDARDTLTRAIEADIPEPSPLFWDRFSEQVRDEIGETTASASAGWRQWLDHAGLRWAVSGAIIVALIAGAAWRVTAPTVQHTGVPAQPSARDVKPVPSGADVSIDDGLNADADPAWAVVRTLADEVPWSDSVEVGLAARPDAAERVADTLTSDERSELLRLLRAEIKRPGA